MTGHDDDLLTRLRALPSERTPPADGWLRVRDALPPRGDRESTRGDAAHSIAAVAGNGALAPRVAWRSRRRGLWPAGGALAACLALAWVAPWAPSPPPAQLRAADVGDLPAQAQVLASEYHRAVATLPANAAAEWQPALVELDRSAEQIRQALAESPRSLYLLEQLQRTYTLRLELTRQAALAAPGLAT